MLNRTKISTRVIAGFSAILLATLLLGVVSVRSIDRLAETTASIFRHPFVVSMSIREAMTEVLVAQQVMSTLVQHSGPSEVEQFRLKLDSQRQIVDGKIAMIRERYLGSPRDVEKIERALAEWRAARARTIELVRGGHRAEAIAAFGGHDEQLFRAVLASMQVVSDFAGERAAQFKRQAEAEASDAVALTSAALLVILCGGVALTLLVTRSVRRSLQRAATEVKRVIESSTEKARLVEAIGAGDLSREIVVSPPPAIDLDRLPDDETGILLRAAAQLGTVQHDLDEAFRNMTGSLREARERSRSADWLKSGLNELHSTMRGELGTEELADRVLTYLVEYLHAGVGALYLFDERAEELSLVATYAFTRRKHLADRFRLGEGLIGQAARERKPICIGNVPGDYLPIGSALGEAVPKVVFAMPLLHGNRLIGAFEIGAFAELDAVQGEFLALAQEAIAIGLSVGLSRQRTTELLEETQQQAEELRVQQEELQQSNEELEERARVLETQRENIRKKNREIEVAAEQLQRKAQELEQVSAYKSEFLANMSHELRTPLNSLMILSSLLMQNKDGNLTAKQVEFASTIHAAGTDLLNLINDILDLAKIEAGRIQLETTEIAVDALADSIGSLFRPQADQKRLALGIELDPALPRTFQADEQRVHQIVKNLLSNALKFTERGEVTLRIAPASAADNPLASPAIAFAVSDTGIGIPPDKQQAIFEAFQQADGSISRKYGGTGLGLSISLELARRMGGDLRMRSVEGQGSVFTLYLPLVAGTAPVRRAAPRPAAAPVSAALLPAASAVPAVPAAAAAQPDGDAPASRRSVLVIEDDEDFARILHDMIEARGFTALVADSGERGIDLAERELPSAIILDVMLPGIDGWGVMRSLKDNPRTRHIPVHFLTCLEDRQRALGMAAIGFVTKPVDTDALARVFEAIEQSIAKSVKRVLVVEDDQDEAYSIVALLDDKDVELSVAASGAEACTRLETESFDCVVLDLGLPGMSGFELLDRMQTMESAARVPVVVHSGRELAEEDERRLRRYADSIVIKGAKSPERLVDEVSLFLHQVETRLPATKQRMIRAARDKEAMLEGRKVLIVDDDMRNLFSLAHVLAEKNMVVIEAENGRKALERLDEHPDVSIVLMDIMMPETDGYTATREIRRDPRFEALPVIAMTAKAMKGDYEKCIAAGATDYLAKPIDVDKLFSLIRVWLYQRV